jgi:hypothetical protein
MIDKIGGESRIQESTFEETPEVKEQQVAQDNIAPEAESVVTATPEYKSGLIAEKQIGGQTQEMLLRNQLTNDTERKPVSFTRDSAPRETPKSPGEILREMPKQIPEQLSRTVGEIGEAWSHPVDTVSNAIDEAKRKWDDIKAGK